MSYVTSFETLWGTALTGFWVKWTPTTGSLVPPATTISATSKMKMEFDIVLYGIDRAGIESENGATTVKWAGSPATDVVFYMLFQNPVDKNDYDAVPTATEPKPVYNDFVSYDGIAATFTYSATEAANAADSNLVLKPKGANGTTGKASFVDQVCTALAANGKYDSANCLADSSAPRTGGNDEDWVPNPSLDPATANVCTEIWTVSAYNSNNDGTEVSGATQRCVRVQFTLERLFKTGDNATSAVSATNTFDMDWELRKYSVTAGWRINSISTTAPSALDFAAKLVDFH